jgi:MFS family permease
VTDQEIYRPPEKTPRFYPGYYVVGASFVILAVSWGVYVVYGVFFNSLIDEFSWTHAVTSGAYSLSSIISGVLGIIMGGLTDRFGPRLVVTFTGLVFGIGLLLMSRVNSLWQLYLFFGIIVGIGMSGLWVPLLTTVARWFTKTRSLMTGITISGLTVGQIIGPPVVSRLIDTYQWRDSYIIIGIFSMVVLMLAAQLMRRNPKYGGKIAADVHGNQQQTAPDVSLDYSLKEAMNTVQFWLATTTFLFFGFMAYGLTVHIVPHITRLGISEITAASVLSVSGGVGIIGNFVLGGLVGDRIGNRKTFMIGIILAITALALLAPAKELWLLYLFAVLLGLALGGMGTSESPLTARLFGLSSHGLIYGVMGMGFTTGGAIGPIIIGYIFDVTESYRMAFLVCIGLLVIGLVFMAILKPTRKLGREL